ncbi:protein PSK SIMULATOR 1-like [Telopea speciosissima]|uniref:protein PSK SIMULATOR 1-like n=1 Tax=Telopea speciosissima TaxID=54955 RepID=UPI001CC6DA82|nr:protein PSK SIMULATOR 1-like [Telopea speciosissima]XP_043725945.1 protein PSK SIMULATOR 1-like [Telopea speciosissima]
MVMESWFGSWWKNSRRNNPEPGKVTIGVLAFEVASLMSKVVHLWQCLSDKQVVRLREEIMNSVGVRKLVSDDDDFLVGLVYAEMVDNLGFIVRSVARLGKKCSDPVLQRFEHVFDELVKTDEDLYHWELTWKKMDRKVRKMERFIGISTNLYQELEVLAELEQTLRRMQASNDDPNRVSLLEFQQKVVWQRQEVKNLRERSLWNRTYDYTILFLGRSLFTIFRKIKHVFGINHKEAVDGVDDSKVLNTDYLSRSHSVSTLIQSSVHPSEKNRVMFSSGPLGQSISKSGPISSMKKASNRHQHTHENSSTPLHGKNLRSKTKRLPSVGPFKGCMMGGSDTPVLQSYTPVSHGSRKSNVVYSGILNGVKDANAELLPHSSVHRTNLSLFSSKQRLLNAPPSTLGAAALALHYANVIIVIERLVTSSHLIGPDARDDLYNMLPTSVRMALRARLKSYSKNMASSFCDGVLAAEWNDALARILEWLAPLAHNMIRWHSERNFEQQNLVSRTNVLLVQTLYFANQAKTEAAITELLVGLNYIWRFGRDLNAKALRECTGSGNLDDYLDLKG